MHQLHITLSIVQVLHCIKKFQLLSSESLQYELLETETCELNVSLVNVTYNYAIGGPTNTSVIGYQCYNEFLSYEQK
jgi:hypothetical protein